MKGKGKFKEEFIGNRRFELFKRDPLAQDMESLFRKSHSVNLPVDEKTKLNNRIEELWKELMKKWNCHISPTNVISDEPFSWLSFSSGAFTVADATEYIKKLSAKIKKDLETRSQSRDHYKRTGWIFYYLNGGYDDRGNIYIPIPPISVPIIVDIGGLTEKDKVKVTEEIWNIVKPKIKEKRAKTEGQWKSISSVRDSHELGFLSAMTDGVFVKYLKWYDLHMGGDYQIPKGLYFRTIAYHEFLERKHPDKSEEAKKIIAERTKTIKTRSGKEKVIKGYIGQPVNGEDHVEKAVKLIYQAIHRKPYPSKKKMSLLNCPEHGDKCPKECNFFKAWIHNFSKKNELFKPLVTTDKELSTNDFKEEIQKADERIDIFFKNKKRNK